MGTSGDADDVNIPDSQTDNTGQVYDFKDNKTTGTVTATKVWDDGLTNEEREYARRNRLRVHWDTR